VLNFILRQGDGLVHMLEKDADEYRWQNYSLAG
jgi:hypothetical protein